MLQMTLPPWTPIINYFIILSIIIILGIIILYLLRMHVWFVRTVYKLCALVDIQKTLMFLCCVPYLQLSGSHAISILLRLRTKLLKQVA